jgi:hypothetical protein
MASIVLGQILDKFAGDFTEYLDCILTDIAAEYDLDLDELQNKYLRSEFMKKKGTRSTKKKSESDDDRQKCEAKTAKGDPCKNNALTGSKFCRCHTKDKEKEKPKKTTKPKKSSKPVHSHSPSESESECEACEKLGDGASTSKVPENVSSKIDNILANLETDDEEEDEQEALKKELFGSDDDE